MKQVSDDVVAMVRRRWPAGAPVVSGSTPVVAFGDPARAEVATLGINPSRVEFVGNGSLLTGAQRRLATLESLDASSLEQLSDAQIAQVVADCAAYFSRNPYRRWFDPLDQLLREAADASFYDGTACHLDLVQWATDPVWGRIGDRAVRQALLEDGVPHLRAQLAGGNVRLVLLNGRQVIDQVSRIGLTELTEVDQVPLGQSPCRLVLGDGAGVRWVGWSTNLQSSWGVTAEFRAELARRVARLIVADGGGMAARAASLVEIDGSGHLTQGVRVSGKRALVDLLREWRSRSSAATIGDVGQFGGRAWLQVELAGHEVVLNADTKRAAVEAFLQASARDPQRAWRVVANVRGRVNKVVPNPDGEPLPGWYAYVVHPLSKPGEL